MQVPRILVVDDCRMTCLILRHILAREGIRCDAVPTGEEALPRLRAAEYSLVLIDIVLPGRSGTEVAREVGEVLGEAAPPVYLLTGLGEDFREDMVQACGAEGVFFKPIAPAEILAVTRQLVRC